MSQETDQQTESGGPMVGICIGHRCSALWRLRDGACGPDADPLATTAPGAVRRAIAGTPGGVLTSLSCVGACAQAPLIGVADRRPGNTSTGQITWIGGADAPDRQAALLAWLADDWRWRAASPPAELLPGLFRRL